MFRNGQISSCALQHMLIACSWIDVSIHSAHLFVCVCVCVCVNFSNMCGVHKSLCCCCLLAKSCLTLWTPWTIACQAPLSMGFPRQEYWSRLPYPSPGDLPNPGIKPMHPALACGFFMTKPPGKSHKSFTNLQSSAGKAKQDRNTIIITTTL